MRVFLLFLFFLTSCNNIEFILKDGVSSNPYKNNTSVIFDKTNEEVFIKEVLSTFGNNTGSDYILIVSLEEQKENRLVKKNQVAEKIDYELRADYKMFYKKTSCNIFNKKIITKFSFVPKSFGYNFGTDKSLERLYAGSVKKNIQNFINSFPDREKVDCL